MERCSAIIEFQANKNLKVVSGQLPPLATFQCEEQEGHLGNHKATGSVSEGKQLSCYLILWRNPFEEGK